MTRCNTNILIAVGICDRGFEPSEMKVCLESDVCSSSAVQKLYKGKLKLSLFLIKHHAMKMYGE